MIVSIEELRRLRINIGMSQSDLADEVGVSQAYIARIEKGSLDPKYSIVQAIITHLSGSNKTCGEIMTEDVETIDARSSILDAAEKLSQGGFSHLPVLRGTRLVGSISQRDIVKNLNLNLREMNVEAIMDPEGIPMVNENTPVISIIPLLQIHHGVIVQKQGRLSGIITTSDLLRNFKDGILVL
jgi:predicted transcriptional regulator